MKKILLVFALIVGLLASASTMQAQTVNMSRYITLTVKSGKNILLCFKAATAGTPVRIVSGSNTYDITADTDLPVDPDAYSAGDTKMTVYGNLTGFDCSQNDYDITAIDVSHNTQLTELDCFRNDISSLDVSKNTQLERLSCGSNNLTNLDVSKNTQLTKLYCGSNKLTTLDVSKNTQLERLSCYKNRLSSLDVSKNTQLKTLSCHGNAFTTAALDAIYCALPARLPSDNAQIFPLDESSPISEQNMVTATNAANASAKKWKVQKYNGSDNPNITTTGTYVCQVNTSRYITLTVADGEAIKLDFQAAVAATPVRIESGSNTQDITVGTSWKGTASYTADDTEMTVYGDIIGFDCSQNGANLAAIDVSHNTQLKRLDCWSNLLSNLDVSHNTELKTLFCYKNRLSSLDISHNTQLTMLDCKGNGLTSLDVSKNIQLKELYCHSNNFSTQALDDIYCALPVRSASDNAAIYLLYESSPVAEQNMVAATNAANATAKNWRVLTYKGDGNHTNITTTGTYDCSTSVTEASAEQALTLYPNPVADVLYLSATARTIRIYN
ncbi:MAG: cell wall anchor protein, partial [Bacteroidota bacterium]